MNPVSANSAARRTSIGRTVTTLAGGEILGRLIAFAATAALARRLGPDGFGAIGFASALSGYLILAVNGGMHDAGTREVARWPARASTIFTTVAGTRLLLATGAFGVLALVALSIPKPPTTQLVVALTGLSFFSFAVDPSWVLKGLERPTLVAIGQVVAQVVYVVLVLALIDGPADVLRVPVLQFTGEVIAALSLCAVVLRGATLKFSVGEGYAALRQAGYLSASRIVRTIVISFDVVLLGFWVGEHEVGLYSSAYRLTFLLMAIAAAMSAAYLPTYTRAAAREPEKWRRLIGESLFVALAIGAPLVVGTAVTAGPLLETLFGADYVAAAPALSWLALSVGLLFLHWSVGNVLIVAHRTRLQAGIHAAAAATNVVLNVLWIPKYGITGSAVATFASELLVVLIGAEVLRRMHLLPRVGELLPAPFAATLMGLVVLALPTGTTLLQKVLAGIVAYTLCFGVAGARRFLVLLRSVDRGT